MKLLSPEIHAVYWSPLTARAWRILNWLRKQGKPRSRYVIAETLKIPHFRGVEHPAPPQAYAVHSGMSRGYYNDLTTVPSMQRTLGFAA